MPDEILSLTPDEAKFMQAGGEERELANKANLRFILSGSIPVMLVDKNGNDELIKNELKTESNRIESLTADREKVEKQRDYAKAMYDILMKGEQK